MDKFSRIFIIYDIDYSPSYIDKIIVLWSYNTRVLDSRNMISVYKNNNA